jgi:hypothetical protein
MASTRHTGAGLVALAGAGALTALVFGRRSRSPRRKAAATPTTPPGRWVWPVQKVDGRAPVVSNGWKPGHHLGVDIMFRRAWPGELVDRYPPGSPNGAAWHYMPDDVLALAASDGLVWSAGLTPRGYAVVLDHGKPWATYYTHLAMLLVEPTRAGAAGERVAAGQPIGIVGADPKDSERLKHLHWELWHGGGRDHAIDPEPLLTGWPAVAGPAGADPLALASTQPPRNGGLVYRPVGSRGEPYPDWLRRLSGSSGVYVIRQDGEVVYVGSSSADRLYETITRHLQSWRRWKGFWKGQFGEGHDPGLTYDRGRVEVAVRVTPPSRALDEEARLIRRLRPRDNLIGQPPAEEVPF